jgi:hypothetical protein
MRNRKHNRDVKTTLPASMRSEATMRPWSERSLKRMRLVGKRAVTDVSLPILHCRRNVFANISVLLDEARNVSGG